MALGPRVDVFYRSDSGQRFRGLASVRSHELETPEGRRNTSTGPSNLREVSLSMAAGRVINGFRCRYVIFQVLEPPYSGMVSGGYHRLIVYREARWLEFASSKVGWQWNGVPVRGVSAIPEYRRNG